MRDLLFVAGSVGGSADLREELGLPSDELVVAEFPPFVVVIVVAAAAAAVAAAAAGGASAGGEGNASVLCVCGGGGGGRGGVIRMGEGLCAIFLRTPPILTTTHNNQAPTNRSNSDYAPSFLLISRD